MTISMAMMQKGWKNNNGILGLKQNTSCIRRKKIEGDLTYTLAHRDIACTYFDSKE